MKLIKTIEEGIKLGQDIAVIFNDEFNDADGNECIKYIIDKPAYFDYVDLDKLTKDMKESIQSELKENIYIDIEINNDLENDYLEIFVHIGL